MSDPYLYPMRCAGCDERIDPNATDEHRSEDGDRICEDCHEALLDCATCGGHGGGDEPHLRCLSCHGTGRAPAFKDRDE